MNIEKQSKIKVLYLDDEMSNLQAFKASFRRDFEIHIANTPAQAFELLSLHQPHVVFSDQRMPEMSGVEFLQATRQVSPRSIRVLLTAYTDVKDIIEAINKGHIYRFITKPWVEEEIRQTVVNAFELYNVQNELRIKLEQLERTSEELNKFIYSASHDLRSPLMSILGLIQVAEHQVEIGVSSRDILNMIESSVHRLDTFIKNIVEYYQNSRNVQEVNLIDFKRLTNEILNNLSHNRLASHVHFDVDIHSEHAYFGDAFRLRIILSNLISNAIQYQREDEEDKRVSIKICPNDHYVSIEIEDNGTGILEEHVKNIFKMFFRANAERSGSGIGLYVVKEALNKLDGEIEVSSEPQKGTKFSLKIPALSVNS